MANACIHQCLYEFNPLFTFSVLLSVCGHFVLWSDGSSQFVTLNSHIVPQYSQNFSWVFKPWAKMRVLLMCTLRSFSHKPKKTCFILSFTLKLWYEQSDHKMEQSDHAMMQGLSQLYCPRRQFVPLWPLQRDKQATAGQKIFYDIAFLLSNKVSLCCPRKKKNLIQCYGWFI